MLKLAKVLIMLVRLIAVFSIVLGVLILSGTNTQYIGAHMGLGFFIVLLVIILAILALVRRAVGLGLVAIVFAFLLAYVGLRQFPLRFGWHLSLIQISHVIVALVTLGIAEALYGAIRRAE